MDKKNSSLNIHLPAETRRRLELLAVRKGVSASEYGLSVLEEFLEILEAEHEYMITVFGSK
jgi:predicted DNA-binding protein